MSQLYLLVEIIEIIEIVVVYNDLYGIHEKFEYSCDVTNKAHPHPSWLVYFVLRPNLSLLTLLAY